MQHKPKARVIVADSPERYQEAIRDSARLLAAGNVVVLPTETVYGLAANAFDPAAVARIYEIKGRPAHNPIIVHVSDEQMARKCVRSWPAVAHQLCRAFWPGPLTLVLPRSDHIPAVVTAGGDTVGIRCPAHDLIQAVIRECGFPLAAPSANPANRVSPTRAEHVLRYFGEVVPLIVDGGPAQVGIESTVLDLGRTPPRILRPGMVHEEALRAVVGEVDSGGAEAGASGAPLRSPGLLRKHYSPRARVLVLTWKDELDLRHQARDAGPPETIHVLAHTRIPHGAGFGRVAVIPHEPEAFARAIYAEMLQCDLLGARCIILETPPAGPRWRAVTDRITRAAASD